MATTIYHKTNIHNPGQNSSNFPLCSQKNLKKNIKSGRPLKLNKTRIRIEQRKTNVEAA